MNGLLHTIKHSHSNNLPFVIPEITNVFVSNQLANLPQNKSIGLDNINSKILKIAAPFISSHLTRIINLSLNTGIFPTAWKSAKVIPIYKKGDPTLKTNYRPISILPIISKIIERHVSYSLYNYTSINNILHVNQSGFRPRHGCETSLLKISQNWYTSLNNKLAIGVLFLDFSKAFDRVKHVTLLKKLSMYNLSQGAINWFASYLSDRNMSVCFNNHLSKSRVVLAGVPQGSILGPLLFLLYVNDLFNIPISSKIDLYADDSTIHFSGQSVEYVNDVLNQDLTLIASWSKYNSLELNYTKSKCMLISTPQYLKHQSQKNLVGHIGSNFLENVSKHKVLGVIVDSKLSWSSHIDYITMKCSMRLKALYRIKDFFPIFARLTYFNSFILYLMNYCSAVWSGAAPNEINRLFKIQKRGARLIFDKDFNEPHEVLFSSLHWSPIQSRLIYRKSLLVYQAINKLLPYYLQNMFTKVKDVVLRVTRSSNTTNLIVPFPRIELFKRSFSYSGAILFNQLDNKIKHANSVNSFKRIYFSVFK